MRQIIIDTFDNHLKKEFKEHPNVLKFLLNHERKQLCINNLIREFKIAEWSIQRYDLLTLNSLKMFTVDFANMFAKAALKLKEQNLMSEASKQHKMHQDQETQDYIKFLNEDSDVIVDTYTQ
jgi:hypothetical protein